MKSVLYLSSAAIFCFYRYDFDVPGVPATEIRFSERTVPRLEHTPGAVIFEPKIRYFSGIPGHIGANLPHVWESG